MNKNHRRRLIFAAVVVLLLMGVATGELLRRLGSANEWLLHTREVQLALAEARNLLADAETAQRGFLLTADARFLDPVQAARPALLAAVARIERLTRDNPSQQERVAALRQAAVARLQALDEIVALARQGRRDDAIAQVTQGGGTALMRRARALIDAMEAEEARLLEHRLGTVRQQETAAHLMLALLTLAGVTLLLGVHALMSRSERGLEQLAHTLEAQVQARTASLSEANARLEAFTYMVSHDLRAPLRSIEGFAVALGEDHGAALQAGGREFIERIVAAAARMERLIDALLTYSRLSRAELAPVAVPLAEPLREALQQLAPVLQAQAAEVRIEEPLPTVIGHPMVLTQVMLNLVGNAVKFVAPGVPARVRIHARSHGGMARLQVDDNGIGIAPAEQARIFVPFERLHGLDHYAGSGIGLAIVKKGIERLGGSAGVDSQPGHGSSFWFELPIAHGEDRKNNDLRRTDGGRQPG